MDQGSIFHNVWRKKNVSDVIIIIDIGYAKKMKPTSGTVIWILPQGQHAGALNLMMLNLLHRLFQKNQKPVSMRQNSY